MQMPSIIVRRYLYEEPYHLHLEFRISNGEFSGAAEIYMGVHELKILGEALQQFPSKIPDEYKYEYGSNDPKHNFYRHMWIKAYTIDSRGYCAIKFHINLKQKEPQEGIVEFSIPAEAAAINRLGKAFSDFSNLEHAELQWTGNDAYLFIEHQT